MTTATANTAHRRPKAKGIISLLSSRDNYRDSDAEQPPEFLTYHPYDETTLRQTNQLLLLRRRRRRTKKHASSPLPLSSSSTSANTRQLNLDDLLESMDLIILFFAEARGCAHSIRVRTMVSHFVSSSTTNHDIAASEVEYNENIEHHDNNNNHIKETYPSCCCIVILNGTPDEAADWKHTFVEGTGFYVWPPVTIPTETTTTTTSLLGDRNDISLGEDKSRESLPSNTATVFPPFDRRRSALIQLLSITQVPTLVVINTKTGRPVTHDALAIMERQWWNLTTYYHTNANSSDDDDDEEKKEKGGEGQVGNETGGLPLTTTTTTAHCNSARDNLLQEWNCGRSGWSTVPWVVHNLVSCSVM